MRIVISYWLLIISLKNRLSSTLNSERCILNSQFSILITILLTFSFQLSTLNSQAQPNYPHELPYYPFIHYASNNIQFFGDSSAFDNLYAKFDDIIFQGKGKVNMVHIGGSHIQADIWSERMRERLQKFSTGNNGGRGFIFPYKIAKTNNPYNYIASYDGDWEFCKNTLRDRNCNLGLSGIAVTTFDTTSHINISFREEVGGIPYAKYDVKKVKVFHDFDSTQFEVKLFNDSQAVATHYDSLGYTEFVLSNPINKIELEIYRTDTNQTSFTLYGITLETEDPGFVYNAIGVNGASTSSYLKCKQLAQHISVLQPDLVVFSIGINDAYDTDFNEKLYFKNYSRLIDEIKELCPNVHFLLTTNNDSYYKRRWPNKNAYQVREQMQKLSEKYNTGVWDMFEVMGGLGSVNDWIDNGLAKKDKIHLTREGYNLMGDLMFSALIKSYDDYLKKTNSEPID